MKEQSQDDSNPPEKKIPDLPKPRPFHMTDPHQERGLWCFWLTAEQDVLRFVYNLNCTLLPSGGALPFGRRLSGRVMFAINPRYDHEETWLWLHEVLESESSLVELGDNWETAIREAQIKLK